MIMQRIQRRGNNHGLTLIEIMISLAILVVASAGALQAIQMANILATEANETTIAINDARAVVERIKLTDLSALPVNGTVDGNTIWSDLGTIISGNLSGEQIQITGGGGNTIRQITVTVNWTGPRNKAKTVQFTTLKSFFNG